MKKTIEELLEGSSELVSMLSDTAPDEMQSAAWTYLMGSIPRGAKLVHEAGEDGSAAKDEAGIGDKVKSTSDWIIKGDKVVDVVQEAAAEGGPWATEFYTQLMSGNMWGMGG